MTDHELLELAAEAAGYSYAATGDKIFVFSVKGQSPVEWNPLTDDGDALRLAVKLNLGISIPVHKTIRADVVCFCDSSINVREEGGDPYAATRLAITKVAAEIGKEQP